MRSIYSGINIIDFNQELKTFHDIQGQIPRSYLLDLLKKYIQSKIINISNYNQAYQLIDNASAFNQFCDTQLNDKVRLSDNEFHKLLTFFDERIESFIITNLSAQETININDINQYDPSFNFERFLNDKLSTLDNDIMTTCKELKLPQYTTQQLRSSGTAQLVRMTYLNKLKTELSKKTDAEIIFDNSIFNEQFINQVNEKIKYWINDLINYLSTRFKNYINDNHLQNQLMQVIDQSFRYIFTTNNIKKHLKEYADDYNYMTTQLNTYHMNEYIPLIIQYVKTNMSLPTAVKNNPSFFKDCKNFILSNNNIYIKFSKALNKILLPMTKKRLKWLNNPNIDSIGQELRINVHNLDLNNRAVPFVIINNKCIKGYQGEAHSELIARLNSLNTPDELTRVFGMDILKNDAVAFGHIVGKLAFIDNDISLTMDLNKAKRILINQPDINKVYTSPHDFKVTRLAHIIY